MTTTTVQEHVTVKLNDLIPFEQNPREIHPDDITDLARVIQNNGYISRIVVDEANVILAGHTRQLALLQLNYDEIEVLKIIGLSDEQKSVIRIADNRLAQNSEWDQEKLQGQLTALNDAGDLMQELFTGFDPSEIAIILEPQEIGGSTATTEFTQHYLCPKCGHEWSSADE